MILVKIFEHDHAHEHGGAHRVESFPCTIGRSMRCAIRIDDQTVSACHAELVEESGDYVLRDLGSTNGLVHKGEKVREVRLVANETVYLGDVRLELLVDESLPKTREIRILPEAMTDDRRTTPWKIGAALVFAYAGMAGVPLVDQFTVYWPPERSIEILGTGLAYWATTVGAAFLISLFCKLSVKRFNYHRVLTTLILAGIGAKAASVLAPTIAFNLRLTAVAGWILPVGYGLVAFGAFFSLQRAAFRRWPSRRRAAIAVALAAVTVLLVQVIQGRLAGVADRDRMSELGFPLRSPGALRSTPDDLIFDAALSIAETDERRIRTLEQLEAERDAAE